MSKAIKNLIVKEYKQRFTGVEGAVAVEIRGLSAISTNRMRTHFRAQNVRVTVVKNSLARRAWSGSKLEPLNDTLTGPTAVVYGTGSVIDVARELVKWAKKVEQCTFKGACFDGVLYKGKAGVEKLSRFPTREEAQATVVTLMLSPGKSVVGAAVGPGRRVLGIVKEIQTRLEKGETIAAKA